MGISLSGIGAPRAVRGLMLGTVDANGGGAGGTNYGSVIPARINLADPAARASLIADMKPVYTAGVNAFNALPMDTQLKLADVTHEESYFKAQVLDGLKAGGTYVAPVMPEFDKEGEVVGTREVIIPGKKGSLHHLKKLMDCLTENGQAMIEKMLKVPDKAFIVPADILDGKEAEFYAFFGKTDPKVAANLVELKAAGKGTKILNNLYMSSSVLLAWVDKVFTGEDNAAMKALLMGLQKEAVVDSAIIIAAQDSGYLATDQADPIFHQMWMTHNDWGSYGCDPLAEKNFEDLTAGEQDKDTVILRTHTAMRKELAPVIAAVIAAVAKKIQ